MTTPHPSWLHWRWLTIVLAILLAISVLGLLWWWRFGQLQSPLAVQLTPVDKPSLSLPSPTVAVVALEPSDVKQKSSSSDMPKSVLTSLGVTPSHGPTPGSTTVITIVQPGGSTTTPTTAPTPLPTALPSPTPMTTPTPTSILTPTPVPQPDVVNGNFTQGLTAWQTQGEVGVLPLPAEEVPEELSSATFLARLGSNTNLAWLGSQQLNQSILLTSETSTLQFWYRLWTEETTLGFDDPALVVMLDGQVIWRVGAVATWPANPEMAVFASSLSQPFSSDWQLVSLPLAQFAKLDRPHMLQFVSGQTGDQNLATWADVTSVALAPAMPESPLVTPSWWPASLSLEWPVFNLSPEVITTYLVGSLSEVNQLPLWTELVTRLQSPNQWQGHTVTHLASTQANEWQPMTWYVDSAQAQPNFIFPFSLNHEGFTGPVLAGTPQPSDSSPQLPPPPGAGWMGWDMVWDVLHRPQGIIWLSASEE